MTPLLRACSGLIVWAVLFSLLYAIEGIGCAQGWDATALRGVLVAIWLVGIAGLIALVIRAHRHRDRDLMARLSFRVALSGLVATIITGVPVATLSLCL